MRWDGYVNADEVRKAISTLQAPGKVFEVRIIGTAKKDILSGYFRDAETLLQKFDTVDLRQRNVYITLGEVKDECFARAQSECFLKSPQTSSDTEIVAYRWLFIDLDPVRSAGISSSNAELNEARKLARKVYEYLRGLGFNEPVKALSGNGCHLLYRIDIPNDPDGRALVERCLKVLALIFNSDSVKIDTTNSNPSRICKLHGTLAQKGRSTANRPHRMSRLVSVPDEIHISDAETLQRLADELPEEPKPDAGRRGYTPQADFDLLEFMREHGMNYEEDSNDRARIYKLEECPFDHSHKDGDAKIFQYSNGAIAFKCHHNSCRGKRWQDVRLLFDPEAYTSHLEDDSRIDEGFREHMRKVASETAEKPQTANHIKPRRIRKLKTAEALMAADIPEPVAYVGVDAELPLLMEGTCILSAKPKLGKSWLVLSMLIAIARGDDFLGYKTHRCSVLYLDLETSEALQQRRLRKVLKGAKVPANFYLDTETDTIENGFVEQIEAYLEEDPNIGVVAIDVFQIIRSSAKSNKETEYEHAYRDITPLNELAQKHHISIILVCHDRKAVDPDDPFSNILGSTGLQGAASQMMVMFRKKPEEPIHISVKGKTIDGLPELNVRLENAEWSVVEGYNSADQEGEQMKREYFTSGTREAIKAIADRLEVWRGRCSEIINTAIDMGVPVKETPKQVGMFLHKFRGWLLAEDSITVTIINNGTGPKLYTIRKTTIDTIDEQMFTIDENHLNPEESSNGADSEIPFL